MNTQKHRKKIHLFGITCLLFLLSACKPNASFSVSNESPVVGERIVFDASASSAQYTELGNRLNTFFWTFGDQSDATGVTASHTFTSAGTYEVALTVFDKRGNESTATKSITVATGPVVNVQVNSKDGFAIRNANVKVGSLSKTTSNDGSVMVSTGKATEYVVKVTKKGFIPQSIIINPNNRNSSSATYVIMQPVQETIELAQAEIAQTITSTKQEASIELPVNALVIEDSGLPAQGPFSVEFTPWNILGSDLNAMPGNGRAIDAQGNQAELISAGMMTVDFYNKAGQRLQLASGKQATIKMRSPHKSVNGTLLANGTSIPMWVFDEDAGQWKEEGSGNSLSTAGATYPILTANVSHFSTWNWDFKFNAPGTISVKCVYASDMSTAVPCSLTARFTLDSDGSIYTQSKFIKEETTIVRAPTNAKVEWLAQGSLGNVTTKGKATSINTNPVTIVLKEPTTKNFVQCKINAGTQSVPCLASASDNTGSLIKNVFIPEEGALISSFNTNFPYRWNATYRTNNVKYSNNNSVSSNANDNVTILLDTTKSISIKGSESVSIYCEPYARDRNGKILAGYTVPACQSYNGLQIITTEGTSSGSTTGSVSYSYVNVPNRISSQEVIVRDLTEPMLTAPPTLSSTIVGTRSVTINQNTRFHQYSYYANPNYFQDTNGNWVYLSSRMRIEGPTDKLNWYITIEHIKY